LNENSKASLEQAVASLKRYPQLKVEVAGYTDSVGNPDHNVDLSQRRAESVRDFLIEEGIPAEGLSAKGFGPADPIADNATAEGRAANRRVELHIRDSE
jgi:OOP family OmpA-OmpF porin